MVVLGSSASKKKTLDGAEAAGSGSGQAPVTGGPTLRRSQVLSREYRHAINDLPRPAN